MTPIYLDATPIIALGAIGELELVTEFDGKLIVLPEIQNEVTSEPARSNMKRLLERDRVKTSSHIEPADGSAMEILDESTLNGDVRLIGAVLGHVANEESVAIVTDDRRVRTVADGLGAQVTGTIGVIVRAVAEGMSADEGKRLVRRVDSHGLHLTGELRETADRLNDDAGDGSAQSG